MENAPRLSCRNIHKSFTLRGKRIDVLKGIDFSIVPGEVVVVKGRSGEGKTVLLWLLSGIDLPTSGEVCFEGIPYSRMGGHALAKLRRDKIGIVFQSFNLVPSWTALENVEAAMANNGLSRAERQTKAAALLARMGLEDRLDNLPAELSVGQQQRVALARTLVNEPCLIIADEPTGDVDPETGEQLVSLLMSFIREKNASMVLATHGDFTHQHVANRVLELRDGKLTAGTCACAK